MGKKTKGNKRLDNVLKKPERKKDRKQTALGIGEA